MRDSFQMDSTSKNANSASCCSSSPTTSSSIQFPEPSLTSPASSSVKSKPPPPQQPPHSQDLLPLGFQRSIENVTVTVRFRPLSPREIRRGEEIAWYADGETILRNEETPSIAYAYDRVFGPTTTTRHVYDIAAQHVVSGAMEGVNGTIFAYGVTSSGKTHTMHGDQRSPGIIPLAVKDAFGFIQETPNREFLLRVSYLEIYNEVVNDLLNPGGQNLRIREDSQGAFVEGIKEEVVLSPAHALSLIAAGEEHRHVGSTNFNFLSSRSHTIFTLTIESSPCGEEGEDEAVNFSQLNLIDLAGSESSKAETTGVCQKEGSYVNKSLLTLGTVISKLTDGKASHIPYRDSKLTRLLQSSLSGHGRVSLICTVTPSSSNSEETHNTLKFAHRAKHIEIQAAQNKIVDEKSLIKKYQNEIRSLKEELDQLKGGIITIPQRKSEDGQVQSRLEQEDEAKEALLSRIQSLTKLILVSNKSPHASRFSHRPGLRRGYSFGEEELAYLPPRRRDVSLDDSNTELFVSADGSTEPNNDVLKGEKKIKKPGLLNWLKLRKRDNLSEALTSTSDRSSGAKSNSPLSTPSASNHNPLTESIHLRSLPTECTSGEFLSDAKQDQQIDEDNYSHQETPSVEITRLNDKIKQKNKQISLLEGQIADSATSSHHNMDKVEQSRSVSELEAQLSEKSFELEVKIADNRVIQEQLNLKITECEGLRETIASLKQLLPDAHVADKKFEKTEDTKQDLLQQAQAFEIEQLKQKVIELSDSKDMLEARNKKLADESSYAKGLASAAAVELTALSEEVSKLMKQNERLTAELASPKHSTTPRKTIVPTKNGQRNNSHTRQKEKSPSQLELKRELALCRERELSYEALLSQKNERESELQHRVEESQQREAYLENELANMWVMVAKLKRLQGVETEPSESSKENQ
uniref:kinesin-like protein KIN-7K, chloroplastic isoform X2 n=1 Tax=Erigeron canadensis TaxID=72917 RepID=UPI001CB897E2|nr:kinesin-like protein KIN-7K, chloroplastic isoform X2 [Erigeron canadensis]